MKLKKSLGQHFLSDQSLIDELIQSIDPQPTQTFVEIGPGGGALTRELLPHVQHLHAIEIDGDWLAPLERLAAPFSDRFTLHHADALSVQLEDFPLVGSQRFRVVGNLPYYISTPLIFHWLAQGRWIEDIHWMVQKEVAERLYAPPRTPHRGRLSVMAECYCEAVEPILEVPPHAFTPPPQVDSTVVRLFPRKMPCVTPAQQQRLEKVLSQAFQQRRKMLRNSLKHWVFPAELSTEDQERYLVSRPEELSLEDWLRLI